MHPIWLARVFFVLILTLAGYLVGRPQGYGLEFTLGALVGSLFLVAMEHSSQVLSTKKIILAAGGAFFGLAFSHLFTTAIPGSLTANVELASFSLNLLFMYFGVVLAIRNADRISLSRLRFFISPSAESHYIFDTSVIIDGRVIRLYEIGFLSKSAIVPTFVLDELQALSDSRDPAKRQYGRRGLENLEELREVDPNLQIMEKDYPDVKGVDHKLIALAKELSAPIVSNDFNLCKVATLHRITALNINELAAALRLNISIGDQVVVTIQRDGKEAGQGVGHLDDGTMVVVDKGREFIGQDLHVVINSIVQTNAGRLAFAKIIETPTPPPDSRESGERARARIEVVGK